MQFRVKKHLLGMTLVELLATLSIIGLITVAAVPSYRNLQARYALTNAQSNVQAAFYRMQQLTLASITQAESSAYEVVGYGMYIYRHADGATNTYPKLEGCTITTTSDFIAIYKVIRFKTNDTDLKMIPFLADPKSSQGVIWPNCPSGGINPQAESDNFFVFSSSVRVSDTQSKPAQFPWLLFAPVQSVGSSLGEFTVPSDTTNPLDDAQSTARLVIEHRKLKLSGKPLSRAVEFNADTSGPVIIKGNKQ